MLIRISYPLRTGSPLYPGTPPPTVLPYRTMGEGSTSSSSTISFNSHSGTHIDAPSHFCPEGATVADVLGAGKVFSPAGILDIAKPGDTCIAPNDIEPFLLKLRGVRALLVRTGEWERRVRDPAGYTGAHAWIHPAVPALLKEHLPTLQLVGTDAISISSPLHRDEGRACHRSFLCGSPPILILEDLDLSDPRLGGTGFNLSVYPWFSEAVDGIPVVAIMEQGEKGA